MACLHCEPGSEGATQLSCARCRTVGISYAKPALGQSLGFTGQGLEQQFGTRSFSKTVAARLAADPDFRQACLDEGVPYFWLGRDAEPC